VHRCGGDLSDALKVLSENLAALGNLTGIHQVAAKQHILASRIHGTIWSAAYAIRGHLNTDFLPRVFGMPEDQQLAATNDVAQNLVPDDLVGHGGDPS
jgi:hypothetical protein